MITCWGSTFLRSEEITGFEDLNPTELPFTIITHKEWNSFKKYLYKREMKKRGLHSAAQLYGYILK